MSTPKQAIATYMDVLRLFPQLYDKEDQKWEKSPAEIRATIMEQDFTLRTQLRNYCAADLSSTPRVMPPFAGPHNQSKGVLLTVNGVEELTIAESATVYSQVYFIEFTSPTAFTAVSDLSGAQGTGVTDSDFTTTDTFLTIPEELWNGTFVKGDTFYIRVYNHEGMLVTLSAYLAAVQLLDGVFTEEVPDASPTSVKYKREYDRIIRAVQDGIIFLEVGLLARDIDPIQVDYEIDQHGQDITVYREFDWSPTDPNDL